MERILSLDTLRMSDVAVKALLHRAVAACRKHDRYVGICGQGRPTTPTLRAG